MPYRRAAGDDALETAPLLANAGALPGANVLQDHPAFLRASHSPWGFIPQNALVIARGTILAYLVASAIIAIDFKFFQEDTDNNKWSYVFEFAFVSNLSVLIYHVIAFSWTFTHLYYPNLDAIESGIESTIIKAMSLPSNLGNLIQEFRFTLFYTTVICFSFMNTALYWFIDVQHSSGGNLGDGDDGTGGDDLFLRASRPVDFPLRDLFAEGWLKVFVTLNLYGITSAIMVVEILLLNSIKLPFTIGSHLLGLMISSSLYIFWAVIGTLLTGHHPFFWLDKDEVGSEEAVVFFSLSFIIIAPISAWIFMQGIVSVRETLTRPRVPLQQPPLAA